MVITTGVGDSVTDGPERGGCWVDPVSIDDVRGGGTFPERVNVKLAVNMEMEDELVLSIVMVFRGPPKPCVMVLTR